MLFDDSASLSRVCTERLGEKAGQQFAAMARRGFQLVRPTDNAPATGQCRLGGVALLEPGTTWPEQSGVPLSLHAVLDTDALAAWLGDELPVRPGLLNFFYLDPDLPYEEYRKLDAIGPAAYCVIPADPARAVETQAPVPARRYPAVPLHAAELTMLPDCWDVEDEDVEFDKEQHWGAASLILSEMGDLDGNTAGSHCAFGWPDTSYTLKVTSREDDGPAVHLLQLAEDADLGWGWGDAGTLYFTIPVRAFTTGDFRQATAKIHCC
ncbi:DUF1963 domain-containing protein [Actinacidiphila glaucinigra]|uniref:DUF1963 domain-containing protein n=1 Tax=Actinacidiphila glaucinigra TaxID=235986 RepID=A0A239NH31_9ACTN|nr:DUF1963 domain-containing protein [Actinacidiphila glaucinigra]SNT53638.1 protein of unknown function [Actinacidiphila glaucinigra]